jgi:hypothetical protein
MGPLIKSTSTGDGLPGYLPRVLHHCQRCNRETPHEIHALSGDNVVVCILCVEQTLNYELDRD